LDDWQPLAASELEKLICLNHETGARIDKRRLDIDLWSAFAEVRRLIAIEQDLKSARNIAESHRWGSLVSSTVKSLMSLASDSGKSFAGIGLCVHPPGLPTVTFDEAREGFIGLHLDSWYDTATPETSPGRICINLGYESRYFLFSPISVAAMRVAMQAPENDYSKRGDLARAFFRMFPHSPILRLKVDPGEAYIAPTEIISHDGSTDGQTGWDLTLTVRGRFVRQI
jgi:hypothetical protein